MAELRVDTPEGIRLRFEIAGPGTRTLAAAVDLFGLVCFVLLVWTILLYTVGSWSVMILAGGSLLLVIAYQVVFAVVWNGMTPGKRLLGVRVVDQRGFSATSGQHLLRSFLFPLEALVPVPLPIGVIVMTVTPRHQRLGDLLAGTVVLREPAERGALEPFPRESWSSLPEQRFGLSPALAGRFERADLDHLRELLGRPDLDSRARSRLQARAAALYMRRLDRIEDGPLSRADVRAFLRELYLFLREMRARLGAPIRYRDKNASLPSGAASTRGRRRRP